MMLADVFLGFGAVSAVSAAASSPVVSPGLQRILNQAYESPLYTYPTSLTQGIIPKAIHSHNDYWRPVPLFTALSAGCISIEADVWLVNGTLHVGHEQSALTSQRTLQSLYIDPIISILKAENPKTPFSMPNSRNGVFDTDSNQTLYLFIDLKTDGKSTYPAVKQALQPLREGGWLSKVSGGHYWESAITVIGTGNTPQSLVEAEETRDIFFDGPLPNLAFSNITSLISPIASTNFDAQFFGFKATEFDATQLDKLRSQIKTAHDKGIKVRYWDTPGWPISTRNAVWRTLYTEGADLINADDVVAAAGFSDESGEW
ncbi:MAG: hypothetical protein MMC23_004487 [Stictis urceolatum]|nr:hypothetical protein [Stictis urceolata]